MAGLFEFKPNGSAFRSAFQPSLTQTDQKFFNGAKRDPNGAKSRPKGHPKIDAKIDPEKNWIFDANPGPSGTLSKPRGDFNSTRYPPDRIYPRKKTNRKETF